MGFVNNFFYLTPLHVAAKNGHRRIVQILIESGANYNAQTQMVFTILLFYGETPLHFAAMNGHEDVMNDLLNAGADASIADAVFYFILFILEFYFYF